MNINIKEHGYQRNGIGGEGFHYFRISFKDDYNELREVIATLTIEQDDPKEFNGSCRVVTPDNLEDHWRGDNFEYEIRKKALEWCDWYKEMKQKGGNKDELG